MKQPMQKVPKKVVSTKIGMLEMSKLIEMFSYFLTLGYQGVEEVRQFALMIQVVEIKEL